MNAECKHRISYPISNCKECTKEAKESKSALSDLVMWQYLVRTDYELRPRVLLTHFFYSNEIQLRADYPGDRYSIIGKAEWTKINT